MGKKISALALILTMGLWHVAVSGVENHSDDDTMLRMKLQIESLQKQLDLLQNEFKSLKTSNAAESNVTESKNVPTKQVSPSDEKMTVYGDFRYRHESIDDTDAGIDKRNGNRMRARVGAKFKLDDQWGLNFRLASGSSGTPTSTNQTLDSYFSSKDVWIDMAYATWKPAAFSGLDIHMGKMKNPFYKSGKNQVIFDGDVTPEGIAASRELKISESTNLVVTGSGYWLDERSSDADASIFGIQTYIKHKLQNSGNTFLGGISYYDMGNVQGMSTAFKGNTDDDMGKLKYDFDLLEGFAEYGFKCKSTPMAVYGNYVKNIAATSGSDTAYAFGYKLNKASTVGDWEFDYQYRDLQSDAAYAGLNDSDFIGGGTGGRGHTVKANTKISKAVKAGLTYFNNIRYRGVDDQDYERLQVDLVLKF